MSVYRWLIAAYPVVPRAHLLHYAKAPAGRPGRQKKDEKMIITRTPLRVSFLSGGTDLNLYFSI
jgi:hypothetical protein